MQEIYTYQWHCHEDDGYTDIRIFGINRENQNVYLSVKNFNPYVYLELPSRYYTETDRDRIKKKIDDITRGRALPKKRFCMKRRLFYAHKDSNMCDKSFPYMQVWFPTKRDIRNFEYGTKKGIEVEGLGKLRVKVHESDASPILQLQCQQKLTASGWLQFSGTRVKDEDRESYCDIEYTVDYRRLQHSISEEHVYPLIMSFDIEVNSTNPSAMPNADRPGDKIFQISCVFCRHGDEEAKYEKYLLSLGEPDPDVVGEEVELQYFDTESSLLEGYIELIQEKNPNIIVGYNIFGFDIPYMIKRSRLTGVYNVFCKQSCIQGEEGKERRIKWSSSAYGNQEFEFLDCDGRLYVDLLPLISRDYKFDTYSLKAVSTHFLGQTKDPLSVKEIFKCYRIFSGKSLGIVGKYCVQDSFLVAKLFEHLKMWESLTEMSKICNTPIFALYTQGQQIKVFSQVYKYCMDNGYVVEKDGYVAAPDEFYSGAYVFDPVPGLYDMVVSFDFSSLYPSTIIAYNIDYSTLVRDGDNIPDEMCHIFDWTDHQGCEHDTTVRKTKPKNIICGRSYYRFLKSPKGVLPTLLERLLDSRKTINGEIKVLKEQLKTVEDKKRLSSTIAVLDKRQLAMKLSANSMYGALGTRKGYLPFMPGAACTTARGRESIEKAMKHLQRNYGAKLIYGDTDSAYISFPEFTTEKDARECYDFCKFIENETLALFPKPMKLAYEEKIFWRYLILTKKRYMAIQCNRDGVISNNNMFKKGVVLARRDNSLLLRKIYGELIPNIFYKATKEDILGFVIDKINAIFTRSYSLQHFIVTKSTGDISDYKIRPLPEDEKKRAKRLRDLGCVDEQDYMIRALPAHMQLVMKMIRRGKRVDSGSRIEYVVTNQSGLDARLFDKIEDKEYFMDHADILNLDYFYYLELSSNPIDQVLEIVYGVKGFVKRQLELRIKKQKMLDQLRELFRPKLVFV